MCLICFKGPGGRESCFDILCGPNKWQKHMDEVPVINNCTPICKFRKDTIERLRSVGPDSDVKLGNLVEKALSTYPVFEFAVYYPLPGAYPKIQYIPSDFYLSLNHKVARLLAHVDSCIMEHGEDFVLEKFEER